MLRADGRYLFPQLQFKGVESENFLAQGHFLLTIFLRRAENMPQYFFKAELHNISLENDAKRACYY